MNTRSPRKRSVKSLEMSAAKIIIYVHGLANKPEEHVLKAQWDRALFGFDLGERSRMAYWVNRNRHGPPLGDTEDPDELAAMEPRGGFAAASVRQRGDPSEDLLPPEAQGESAESLRRLERELLHNVGAATPKGNFGKKILPAPKFVRD